MKRADELLLLIEAYCHADGRFWVPSAYEQYVPTLTRHISVHGSGDMRALRSLEDKGFIERPPNCSIQIAYRITDGGKARAQTLAPV